MNPDHPDKPIRAFIAILLPTPLLETLTARQHQLRKRLPEQPIRWLAPPQIHLTLRFLGDVPPGDVPTLRSALVQAAAPVAPFQLAAEGLGCFPNPRNPRILWVGVTGQLDPLRQLQSNVEQTTAAWGTREDRPFHPHLTIARAKNLRPAETRTLESLLESLSREKFGTWEVTELTLMQSRLDPQGARYEQLAAASLHRA